MKFTYLGFSQQVAVDKGLDLIDLAILRYFIDFKDSGKMVTEVIENEPYYWVKYESIIESNPIFNIKSKESVARRMKKLVDKNILKRHIKKVNGTFIFFSVGEKYKELIGTPDFKVGCKGADDSKVECKDGPHDFKIECSESIENRGLECKDTENLCRPLDFKVDRGSIIKSTRVDSKVDTKDSSIKDTSIKKIVVDREDIELIKFSWNKSFETNINKIREKEEDLIRDLIEKYSVEEIVRTIITGAKSSYLNGKLNGKVADMSWFFIEDNFIKVMNDFYKDKSVEKGNSVAKPNRFHNFNQRTSDYSEEDLEAIARRKREEYYKLKLGGSQNVMC